MKHAKCPLKKPAILFLALFIFLGASVSANDTIPGSYIFGVFPYLSVDKMDKIYSPVSNSLSNALNKQVRFRTSSSFTKFLSKLEIEYYDFAIIQPFWYPVAVDKHSYLPLLRMSEPFTSLLIVPDSSGIKTIADLKGKIIATPPKFVPVVYMASHALTEQGVIPGKDVKFKEHKSVDSCFQQVMIGNASACVAPPFAPGAIEKSMKIKTRIIFETFSIPNLSLVIHPRVPAEDRRKIKEFFVSLNKTVQGRNLLSNMHTGKFVPIKDKEYDVVRDILRGINK